mmetsp:Transcript_24883/g.85145  ORF Transcript_24883/g.85145 Transcript_24883/m.85145 type:complete len:248 (-) Transcript_24883:1154-1897(-)
MTSSFSALAAFIARTRPACSSTSACASSTVAGSGAASAAGSGAAASAAGGGVNSGSGSSTLGKSMSFSSLVPGWRPPHAARSISVPSGPLNWPSSTAIFEGRMGSSSTAVILIASAAWYRIAASSSRLDSSLAIMNGSFCCMKMSTLFTIVIADAAAPRMSRLSTALHTPSAADSASASQSYPSKRRGAPPAPASPGSSPPKYLVTIAAVRAAQLPTVFTSSAVYAVCTSPALKLASFAPCGPCLTR